MKKKVSIKCENEKSNESKESDTECDKCDEFVKAEKNKPLELEWIFGHSHKVPIVNMTTAGDNDSGKSFLSASGQVFQLFHCDGNKYKSQCFLGHENEIIAMETDSTGRFIVSADISGVINVWDTSIVSEFIYPIRTIYDPYQQQQQQNHERKLSKLALSGDGKNIITASNGNGSMIKLWQWSYGAISSVAEKANDMFELPVKFEGVESLRFNCCCNKTEIASIFVITCGNGIVFGQWDSKQMKLLRHLPSRSISITFKYVDTIFIENTNRSISITKCGSAVIWSNSIVMETKTNDKTKCGSEMYKREYIKSIKLCETQLTVIKSIDECIVIADVKGRIRFYDKELKIIFWCPCYDFIDTVITISFEKSSAALRKCSEEEAKHHRVRDFLIQTQSEIYSVNFAKMKFTKIFYKSDDFITAIDVFPLNKKLICCGNYSGRLALYDYEKKLQVVENQLKLRKRKTFMSDMDVIEIPHISIIAYSRNGHHLMCGLHNGTILCLDPDVLHEKRSFNIMQNEIACIKFSPDSSFVAIYDVKSNMIVMYHDKTTDDEWIVVGMNNHYHIKPICDILYIPQCSSKAPSPTTTAKATESCFHQHNIQSVPRLISLAQDRSVKNIKAQFLATRMYNEQTFNKQKLMYIFLLEYQIVEYDLVESMRENSNNLVITFTKRIYQTAIPTSMTLIYNSRKHEDQILIADTHMKFKIFDKNTFEILATFMGPIYDSYVKLFDANTSFGLTPYSKFFIFSTNKNICLYAMPIDGNPYRTLGVIGHCDGIKAIKVDTTRHILFTIGHKCNSLFMWHINFQPLFDHVNEGGNGLKPYCDLLPGGKYGTLFQDMQDLYYYMLMLSNDSVMDDRTVKDGLDINEIGDYFRGLGCYPSDYEIECINHELHLHGKRKIGFEDLVKFFVNHAPIMSNGFSNQNIHNDSSQRCEMDRAMREFLNCSFDIPSSEVIITKDNLVKILTESAERVDVKDAEFYIEKIFQGSEKSMDKVTLSDFLDALLKLDENTH